MFVFVPERHRARVLAPQLRMRHALPRMAPNALHRQLKQLSREEGALVRRHRFVPLPNRGLWRPCVVTDAASARAAVVYGGVPVARTSPRAFCMAIQDIFGHDLIETATHALAGNQPHFSAAWRFRGKQLPAFTMLLLAAVLGMWLAPLPTTALLAASLGSLYLLQASLYFSAALQPPAPPVTPARLLPDAELPTYTVLVPLYRERRVLPQLFRALARLDYPAEKLDIKLLVEEDDDETRNALSAYVLPDYMEVLVAPRGRPRTKPRALNYGLAFARGDLVCIFDAEDVPHPAQLRVAASIFAEAEENVACLQAPLAWHNADRSFFTRMISIEYAAHFRVVLPWLAALGLPLPLGGTSNHFRLKALLDVGGWDPFNVTEDADLGLRLARFGWRVSMLPRVGTLEEACETHRAWRHQRARWIKGWLQTLLVHLRQPPRFAREAGAGGMVVLLAILGTGVFGSLLHPLLLGWTLWDLFMAPPHVASAGEALLRALSLVVLGAGYMGALCVSLAGLHRTRQWRLLPWVALLPLYWLFISAAAWLALWDFARRPHHWRKTSHGHRLLLQ